VLPSKTLPPALTSIPTLGNFVLAMPAAETSSRRSKLVVRPASHRSGRPRGGQLVADRPALLAAAERVIRSAGPEVTMETIAAEAGVTKPILYRSVGDKDAVAAALAEVLVDRINTAGAIAMNGAIDARDGLRRLIGSFLDVIHADRNLFMFVTDAGSSGDRSAQVLRLADRSVHPIADWLAAQRIADGRDPVVAMTWAYGLIGTLHFAALWWMRDESCSASDVAERLSEMLWSGIGDSGPR
jgi:AcrR family transcriptional regulator